jgi:AcrR family transcriptional regulator
MTTETAKGPKRRYRKRRRAELEAETRRRITEAAMTLHGTVGPARTTVTAVAEEAGVQRATVYRHFPTEEDLFAACSAHWASLNPPPDPQDWAVIADPEARLRAGLAQLYEWYAWARPMLDNTTRDAPLVPAMGPARERLRRRIQAMHAALMRGRSERGRRRARVAAAIGHAIGYPTWRSLVIQQGLERSEAIEMMEALVARAGAPSRRAAPARDKRARSRRGRTRARR